MQAPIAKKITLSLTLLLTAVCASAQTLATAPFTDGSRVVAIGDSITNAGLYQSYAHIYHITRFPERNIEMLNAGLSGDTAAGTVVRYPWDIEPRNGNAATIMLGMNDVSGSDIYLSGEVTDTMQAKRLERVNAYERNMRALVDKLLADGIRPILITPSIYDDTSTMDVANQPGRNWTLGECAKRIKALAAEYNLPVIDFHGPMTEISAQVQANNPEATIVGKDRVHPGSAGHLTMAYLYLKALNAPADVAHAAINARSGTVTETLRCKISDIKRDAKGISFNYLAESLPFPVDSAAKAALDWVPLTDELNRETLQVSGLSSGKYRLFIDGKPVQDYTAAELESGVNLAQENTPQAQQAQRVLDLYKSTYMTPVSKLRAIAFVEHSSSRNLPRPLTLEQVQPRLEQWVASANGRPYQGYFRKTADEYLVNKPQEAAFTEQVAQALPKIREIAQPQQHRIAITRIN